MNGHICTFHCYVLLLLLNLIIHCAAHFLPGNETDEVFALLVGNIFSVQLDNAARKEHDLITILGNGADRIILEIEDAQPVHGLQYWANVLLKVAYQIVFQVQVLEAL